MKWRKTIGWKNLYWKEHTHTSEGSVYKDDFIDVPSWLYNHTYLNSESTQNGFDRTSTPRGSAAATASMRRRRTSSAGAGASGGAAGTMLQFYTDDAPGLKISPNVVLVMSIGFIAFVAILHVVGKLYFVRKE